MYLKFLCPTCMLENKKEYLTLDDFTLVELNDSYTYNCTCKSGHTTNILISNPRYELLYDFGISAYLDGYYREAVLDFAAALERFYEHAIYRMLGDTIVRVGSEKTKLFWNHIKRQSERQLGAFVALYFGKYGIDPALPSKRHVEFRNNVTHKGYFPKKEEVQEYAEFVGKYIVDLLEILPKDVNANIACLYPALEERKNITVQSGAQDIKTMISILKTGKSFVESIEEFERDFVFHYLKKK